MHRIKTIDGLRGFFLLTMTLSHLVLQGGLQLQGIHFGNLMFVESAQGFVFLSGLMVGLVQGRRYMTRGGAAVRSEVRGRALSLWMWTVALVVAAWLARDLIPGGILAWRNWVGTAAIDDPLRFLATLTLIFQQTFMDILPMYVLFLLASPPAIRLVLHGRWMLVAGLSLLIWGLCQMEIMRFVSQPLSALIEAGDGQGVRMAFDPMGWQLPFFAGLICGALSSAGQFRTVFFGERAGRDLAIIALLAMMVFAPIRIMTANGHMPSDIIRHFAQMQLRSNFGPVYLLNFAAAAYLVAWIAIAAPDNALRMLRRIAGAFHWVFAMPGLCLLGRHSLAVYLWHVPIVYSIRWIDSAYGPGDPISKAMLALGALTLLWLPPLFLEYRRGELAAKAA